ncbi:MAG: 50S ribosomal protein L22 [Erysipelotrichaceae bacterium]|jgi:large subunit ribosomal protein L22|nr:50S ribosomal protein L22 [Erysipelotrichaceae bacterium]
MDVKATAKTVRVSPRKARLVLDLVRGKDIEEAKAILKFTPNYAASVAAKVLNSAIANAVKNHQLNEELLYVKACYANEGVVLKRYMPAGKGNAHPIAKRTSHVTFIVAER